MLYMYDIIRKTIFCQNKFLDLKLNEIIIDSVFNVVNLS
jgi:hypothetical protein